MDGFLKTRFLGSSPGWKLRGWKNLKLPSDPLSGLVGRRHPWRAQGFRCGWETHEKKSPEIEGKIFPALSEKGFFQESWITRCSRNFAKPRNFFEIHAVLWDSDSSHMSLVFGLLPKVSCIWKPCWLVLKLLVNRFHVNTWPDGVFGTA